MHAFSRSIELSILGTRYDVRRLFFEYHNRLLSSSGTVGTFRLPVVVFLFVARAMQKANREQLNITCDFFPYLACGVGGGIPLRAHVKTRLCQYEAYNCEKRPYIAKQIVVSKMKGQNILLGKYGLKPHDEEAITSKIDGLDASDSVSFSQKLNGIEGKFTQQYFNQTLRLLPEKLRPEKRKKFKAYDGVNNIFNLAYEVLSWKIHRAIIRAKMEPYLGCARAKVSEWLDSRARRTKKVLSTFSQVSVLFKEMVD